MYDKQYFEAMATMVNMKHAFSISSSTRVMKSDFGAVSESRTKMIESKESKIPFLSAITVECLWNKESELHTF